MDRIDADARSRNMAAIKSKNTKPEMVVRQCLYAMGFRYRLHRRDIPGNPDIVFVGRRKAIFVHGCFWHQHAGCKMAHAPQTRLEYWLPKLSRNIERDKQNLTVLSAAGWTVLTLWECEIRRPNGLDDRLREFLE